MVISLMGRGALMTILPPKRRSEFGPHLVGVFGVGVGRHGEGYLARLGGFLVGDVALVRLVRGGSFQAEEFVD